MRNKKQVPMPNTSIFEEKNQMRFFFGETPHQETFTCLNNDVCMRVFFPEYYGNILQHHQNNYRISWNLINYHKILWKCKGNLATSHTITRVPSFSNGSINQSPSTVPVHTGNSHPTTPRVGSARVGWVGWNGSSKAPHTRSPSGTF